MCCGVVLLVFLLPIVMPKDRCVRVQDMREFELKVSGLENLNKAYEPVHILEVPNHEVVLLHTK